MPTLKHLDVVNQYIHMCSVYKSMYYHTNNIYKPIISI